MILALVTMMGQAQEIKMNETTINDYIPMLNQKGYQAYSFDVSAIKGKNVTINVLDSYFLIILRQEVTSWF